MLTLISTPIGNLADLSPRAKDALAEAQLLACEDTRQTKKLLALCAIETKARLVSYHDHNGAKMRPLILEALRKGQKVGLVSDAGTPLISDPGYKLVKEVKAEGFPVTATAGACAPILALILSGLPSDRFLFHGFLPDKTKQAAALLAETKSLKLTSLFFVSPSKLISHCRLIAEQWGDREACVVRELTKLHEQTIPGTLTSLADSFDLHGTPKGEFVLVVGPPELEADYSEAEIDALLQDRLQHISVKDAVAEIASLTGHPRKAIYQKALAMTK